MECGIFARLETHLTIRFSRKNQLKCIGTAIIMLYICLIKRNVDYFDPIAGKGQGKGQGVHLQDITFAEKKGEHLQ